MDRYYFVMMGVMLVIGAFVPAYSASFSSSFESGNGTNFEKVGPDEYNFEMEPDTNSSDRQWFYFRAEGLAGQTVTFNLLNVDQTNVTNHWDVAVPITSTDGGETWEHVNAENTSRSGSTYTFSHPITSDSQLFAFHYPYTFTRMKERIHDWGVHDDATTKVLGRSVQGRELYYLRITNDDVDPQEGKLGFWIVARQHAAEVTSSWVVDGLVDFLLSNDPQARALRAHAEFNIVPMINPDGVVAGNYRDNSQGVNLNRVWDNPSIVTSPEVALVVEEIDQWVAEGNSYDYFADVHSTSGANPHFAFYAAESVEPSLYEEPSEYHEDSFAFLETMNEINPDFDHLKGESTSLNTGLGRQHQMEEYGVLAFTFEAGYVRVYQGPDSDEFMTPTRHRQVGVAMAKALLDYFDVPVKVSMTNGILCE